ncbi:MAG: hypothetical protein M3P28_00930 [Thermoproteota archaeon]|nr:hypothetical protein [Thermoproteota archaeon]
MAFKQRVITSDAAELLVDMVPESCSIMNKGRICNLPPSHIVSILSNNEEYMIGLVCSDHILLMKSKATSMQNSGRINKGEIRFQKIKPVMTDCVLNQNNTDQGGNCG